MHTLIVMAWALIGVGVALTIGMVIAPAFGFPQMEGSAAIFAVLIARPIGAAIGCLGGLKLARRYAADPQKQKAWVELRSDKETRKAEYAGLNLVKDGDRSIIQGYIEFSRVTPNRTIAFRIGDGPTHLFKLTIPARPKSSPGSYESWFPGHADRRKQGWRASARAAPGRDLRNPPFRDRQRLKRKTRFTLAL